MLRITGGKYRSRKLLTPEVTSTKPTMDRVREGLFNALQFDIKDANVLDLFAGSGSYGLEALSRGASSATFIDNNKEAYRVINENIKSLDVKEATSSYLIDYEVFLKTTDDKFDIIFVDPPYKLLNYKEIVRLILENEVLSSKGILVLESEDDLDVLEGFSLVKKYKYGLAKIYVLRK